MTLPTYTPNRRKEVADSLGIDEQYLYQILKGLKTASPALARQINKIDGKATLKDLRPSDWKVIWPDQVFKSSKRLDKSKIN